MYFQCKMARLVDGSWVDYYTAWIPEHGAKVGAMVELLPEKQFWKVEEVYKPGMDEALLREKQKMDRASLASIK